MSLRHVFTITLIALVLFIAAPFLSLQYSSIHASDAQPPTDLFAPGTPPPAYGYTDATSTIRSRFVTVDFSQIATPSSETLVLNLFDDATFVAIYESGVVFDPQRFIWRGNLKDVPDGTVTLAINGGALAGTVSLPGALYRINDTGQGVHLIEQTTLNDPMPEMMPIPVDSPVTEATVAGPESDDGSLIDVLVVYTPASRIRYGQAGIEAKIILAVDETNQAYINSQVYTRLRLVHQAEVNYVESGMFTDLDRLHGTTDGYMDNVHSLRDTYRADTVSLIEESNDYCGIAYLMTTLSHTFESSAFSVVASNCATDYYSFGHELGHNMGAHHDRQNASAALYPYAYGYWEPGYSFRTIMAYNCPTACERIQYFSNPSVLYNGLPTGVSYEVDPAHAADNALTLNNTRVTVANWRDSSQRVNSGGADYTDTGGNLWAADKAFTAGSWGYTGGKAKSAKTAVAGTDDDLLYQKLRESPGEYQFTVPNGIYDVTLKFAEFDVSKVNERKMTIRLEGTTVETALDIYAEVGKAAALDRTYQVTVGDGVLNIAFVKNGGKKNPVVSAVEVRSQ